MEVFLVQRIGNGELARFNFSAWKQLCLPFRLVCSDEECGGETDVIETPPVLSPRQEFAVAEECPRCGRRLWAKLVFVLD